MAGGPQGFESEGVRGLKALGVRELSYRLAFLACNVAPTNPRVSGARRVEESGIISDPTFFLQMRSLSQFGGKEIREEEQTAESIKSQMTEKEWEKVFEMSQDKNLYHNLCSSLFPTIHGESASRSASLLVARKSLSDSFHVCRERRGEARHPADAVRRRSQNHHRGNLAERRHQRLYRRRSQHGQEPVPEVCTAAGVRGFV